MGYALAYVLGIATLYFFTKTQTGRDWLIKQEKQIQDKV